MKVNKNVEKHIFIDEYNVEKHIFIDEYNVEKHIFIDEYNVGKLGHREIERAVRAFRNMSMRCFKSFRFELDSPVVKHN